MKIRKRILLVLLGLLSGLAGWTVGAIFTGVWIP